MNIKQIIAVVVTVIVIGLPFVANYLQPATPVVEYTIVDKLESYQQHKYSISPTYNFLVVDKQGVRSTKTVDLLTYHDYNVSDIIRFEQSRNSWAGVVGLWELGILMLGFFSYLFYLFISDL